MVIDGDVETRFLRKRIDFFRTVEAVHKRFQAGLLCRILFCLIAAAEAVRIDLRQTVKRWCVIDVHFIESGTILPDDPPAGHAIGKRMSFFRKGLARILDCAKDRRYFHQTFCLFQQALFGLDDRDQTLCQIEDKAVVDFFSFFIIHGDVDKIQIGFPLQTLIVFPAGFAFVFCPLQIFAVQEVHEDFVPVIQDDMIFFSCQFVIIWSTKLQQGIKFC